MFGPTGPEAFAKWASIERRKARATFDELEPELLALQTPSGEARLLASDEAAIRRPPAPAAAARLLPSGDAYTLALTGEERALLVPDAPRRDELWTPRVWPGAVLAGGEVVGTWRRAGRRVAIDAWKRLRGAEREAVVAEAESMPLPEGGPIVVDLTE